MDLKRMVLLINGNKTVDDEHLQHAILLKKLEESLNTNTQTKEQLEELEYSLKSHFKNEEIMLHNSTLKPETILLHEREHKALLDHFYTTTNYKNRSTGVSNTIDIEGIFNHLLMHIETFDLLYRKTSR